jgi:GTPase SAR1 family protein
LWDTAGTERFRAVSRSYYRGAAGALLVYDITNQQTFRGLPTFLNDARALASPNLTVILAGNKADLADGRDAEETSLLDTSAPATPIPSSVDSRTSFIPPPSRASSKESPSFGSQNTATRAPDGREVLTDEASRWASTQGIPVAVEVSALSGDNVEEIFTRLAAMILTKIELGEIDPEDGSSGVQFGDSGGWGGVSDGASIKSGMTVDDSGLRRRRRRAGTGWGGLREWEEVFRLDSRRSRRKCC